MVRVREGGLRQVLHVHLGGVGGVGLGLALGLVHLGGVAGRVDVLLVVELLVRMIGVS